MNFLAYLVGFFISYSAFAKATVFKGLDSDSDRKTSVITLNFNSRIQQSNLELKPHSTFLDLVLKNVMVPESGKFYDITSPYISKVVVVQVSDIESSIRFFVNEKASDIKQVTAVDHLNDKIIITVDHRLLAKMGYTNHLPKSKKPKQDILSESNINNVGMKVDELESANSYRMVVATTFSIVMLSFLLLFYLYKSKGRKLKFNNNEGRVSMKTLAYYALGPKRNIQLLQVGGERLLLGVTPDNINFLTKLDSPDEQKTKPNNEPVNVTRRTTKPHSSQAKPSKPRRLSSNKITPQPKPKTRTQKPTRAPVSEPAPRLQQTPYGSANSIGKDNSRSEKSIEDVTSMIRKKLKDLPSIRE